VNANQKKRIFEEVSKHYQDNLKDKVFAVWGLAFKPQTDDKRVAPSLDVINALLQAGAKIQAFDPEAMHEAKKILPVSTALNFSPTPQAALEGANALILLTEWRVFKSPDFHQIRKCLTDAVIFDGRNVY